MVSCRDCGNQAESGESVCSSCGGFLAGSPEPSLGVFSINLHLDNPSLRPKPASQLDLTEQIDLVEVASPVTNLDRTAELELANGQGRGEITLESMRPLIEPADASGVDEEPVLIVERERPSIEELAQVLRSIEITTSHEPVPAPLPEVEIATKESSWPTISRVIIWTFYLLFVIAVAVAVNRILRAL